MKYFKLCLILGTSLMMLLFQNCQNKESSADEASIARVQQLAEVATVRYFRGGGYPNPAAPWSHDMSIDLSSPDTGFPIQGKHPDYFCFRTGSLTSEKAQQLLDLIAALSIQVWTGPVMINGEFTVTMDGGIETVEITSKDGTFKKYHLMSSAVPRGEFYATNPEELSEFLVGIHSDLAVGCQ